MIRYCDRIPDYPWQTSLMSTRIGCYTMVYGTDKPFFDLWVQENGRQITALLARIDTVLNVTCTAASDPIELSEFICMLPVHTICCDWEALCQTYSQVQQSWSMRLLDPPAELLHPPKAVVAQSDARRLYALISKVWGKTSPPFDAWYTDFCHRKNRGLLRAAVACEDNQDIGCAMTVSECSGSAVVGGVCVLPAWRGQGIGSALVQNLCAWTLQSASHIYLAAEETIARSFYAQLGFVHSGDYFQIEKEG